ncbi:TetR/AcrR family transcriptional regulator [Streptococcus ferus]|uniref:TetR family transcriptional regulator n=1 Tax=Streptococcus ferus TaxID=1345 RepID=A0A2X3W158_9STRE|nr:TetR/AcrR family transcriptional regulator [Streptococcus ferus]SQF40999.1 TetR family transcriptional regulator [Streptococcus ferus]
MASKKEQILDKALHLFLEKGFDKTSISDILDSLNIARGTLYYHFESKEAIMDAIIARQAQKVIQKVEKIVDDHSLPVYDKLFALFAAMNFSDLNGGQQMIDYLNQPQNALFHEKNNQMIVEKISPLLAQVIEEGIQKTNFENPFPLYTAEMILILIIGFLDNRLADLSQEELLERMDSLLHNIERLLGAPEGALQTFKRLGI